MKELKVGMYVRTHNGFISKIIEIKREPISGNEIILIKGNYKGNKDEEYGYVRDYYKKGTSFVYQGEIKEVSENIIDLIELGDYVLAEGEPMFLEVRYADDCQGNIREIYFTKDGMGVGCWNEQIKEVVTKEQINSIKYEVE